MHVNEAICEQLSDIEIVQKSLQDLEFFSCLYNRYEPKLLRYIKRISLSSREEAEDILQEAYVKIWRNLNGFDQTLKLSSWIYRIVHNETISYWRKKKSHGKDLEIDLEERLFENIPDAPQQDDSPNDNALLINKILQSLPIKYREVLVLKFLEMMSYEEISDVLKIPEGTVATRINRAKKAFIKQSGGNIYLFRNADVS